MKLTRLLVDLGELCANYRYLATAVPRLAAVVKANGYGLGAVPVVQALRKEGCTDFFVATPEEGATLRDANDDIRIYVFCGPYDEQSAQAMAQQRLTPVLNDRAQIQHWQPYRRMPAAIHVDTGMNRLGFESGTVEPELFTGLDVCLLLSHLANADEPRHPANLRQIEQLRAVARKFPGVTTSVGGSGGILFGAASDLARAGIALYGGNPLAGRWNPLRTVATLEAQVVALRILGSGQAVGYGGTYITDGETCVAVLGIGYADGVPRRLQGAEVAYKGTRLPVIGRISMDLMHADATAVADAIALGDWVEIFGHTVSVDETAAWADTICYEILAGIGNRVPRCHIGA